MKKNWGPVWFELRAEKGQSDLVTFMYTDRPGSSPIKGHFHHREADGLGRILTTLHREGYPIQRTSKKLQPPPAWKNLYHLIKGLITHPRASSNPWISFQSMPAEPPDRIATLTLSEEENSHLQRRAEKESVSPSFLIVSEMSDLIRKEFFKNPDQEALWLFPVDLRGAFPQSSLEDLILSFVPLSIHGHADAHVQDDYQKLRRQLKDGTYWPFFALSNIGDWIGRRGMKFLVDRTHEKSFWMGSFSDLGPWNQPEICESPINQRIWQLAPPGSPSYPIGLTTIEWCGRRTISMRIHPSICRVDTVEKATTILNQWRGGIRTL